MENIKEKYSYFWILFLINYRYISNNQNDNLRLNNSKDLNSLNDLLKNFFNDFITLSDKNEKLISLLNVTGRLLYYQPFYDGNSRTLKIFINLILSKMNYIFSYNIDDYVIPMLFDDEECTLSDVEDFKKRINLKVKK